MCEAFLISVFFSGLWNCSHYLSRASATVNDFLSLGMIQINFKKKRSFFPVFTLVLFPGVCRFQANTKIAKQGPAILLFSSSKTSSSPVLVWKTSRYGLLYLIYFVLQQSWWAGVDLNQFDLCDRSWTFSKLIIEYKRVLVTFERCILGLNFETRVFFCFLLQHLFEKILVISAWRNRTWNNENF